MNVKIFTFLTILSLSYFQNIHAQQSVARQWNEILIHAIEGDFARPTVHARNLFHTSMAMYDAWAAYDTVAQTFLLGKTVGSYNCPFSGVPAPADVAAARNEAVSYATYRIMRYRFAGSPGMNALYMEMDAKMAQLGYNPAINSVDYSSGSPAALGNYIAQCVISFGLQDGANEQGGYANQYYAPVNPPLVIELPGNPDLDDPNRWQPLTLDVFIDQSGNVFPYNTPSFLSPEWGNVIPFSLKPEDLTTFERDGHEYKVYHDPGTPPYLDTVAGGGTSDQYKWNFALVPIWSSHLEPNDVDLWDISPASIGNNLSYPTNFTEFQVFYDLVNGGDASQGHDLNPKTGQPYAPQWVPRGDYARVLAEFWADGPNSETPPGHWFTILNYVMDQPQFEKRFRGQGPVLNDLEYDVKAYFALGGAMHDVAIAAWGIKGWYDYIRPVSAIRGMAEYGQSSDPNLPSYHPAGLPLVPDYIELVETGDPLAGNNNENVGKIKLYAWRGPDYVTFPQFQTAGVGWILAENWWPYQRPSFVTPPFAGYISGHSTYSRAAAELLTALTGDPYLPGGMGEFVCKKDEYLVFEDGPSLDITLQWATYRDASDQCSLSRIWGGIHPPADDIPGRLIGIEIGVEAFNYAESYFYKDEDEDGFYSSQDCNDNDAAIYPGAAEVCDALDNDCNGLVDDGLQIHTYFVDSDNDSYGDAAASMDTCAVQPPTGYVANASDCDDNNPDIHPDMTETCDGIDNNCNGMVDDGLQINTYFVDSDNDNFGDATASMDTCATEPPAGYAANASDCDDSNPDIHPGITEICDGIDNDCSGTADDGLTVYTYYLDSDNDSYGDAAITTDTCADAAPSGYVLNALDCNDGNADINPDAMEIADGLDNNCNGMIDEGTTGTAEVSGKTWQLFPNPAREALSIRYHYPGELTVRAFRAEGLIVRKSVLNFATGEAVLDLTDLSQGVYWIEVTDAEGKRHFVERLVKI